MFTRAAARKKSSNTSPGSSTKMDADHFALFLMEALKTPDVASALSVAMKPFLEAVVERVDSNMTARLRELQDELKAKDETIRKLTARVEEMEGRIDDQEQYSRRTSVRISGVPEEDEESVNNKVMSIFQSSNFEPNINRIHRVGPKQPHHGPRPIICQFVTYSDKRKCMGTKSSINQTNPHVFINEDLTRTRAALSFTARQKKREGRIADTWTADGRIVVKDLKGTIHYITRKAKFIW